MSHLDSKAGRSSDRIDVNNLARGAQKEGALLLDVGFMICKKDCAKGMIQVVSYNNAMKTKNSLFIHISVSTVDR